MKRAVSLVAFFLVGVAPLASGLAGCGGVKAGKTEFADICLDRMGGKKERCICYVDTLEKELPPDVFASIAQGAYDNRRMNGMLPENLMSQEVIGSALADATKACFA